MPTTRKERYELVIKKMKESLMLLDSIEHDFSDDFDASRHSNAIESILMGDHCPESGLISFVRDVVK